MPKSRVQTVKDDMVHRNKHFFLYNEPQFRTTYLVINSDSITPRQTQISIQNFKMVNKIYLNIQQNNFSLHEI